MGCVFSCSIVFICASNHMIYVMRKIWDLFTRNFTNIRIFLNGESVIKNIITTADQYKNIFPLLKAHKECETALNSVKCDTASVVLIFLSESVLVKLFLLKKAFTSRFVYKLEIFF